MHYLQWCTIYNVRTYLFEWYLFESADFTFEHPFNSLNIYIRSDLFNKFTPNGSIIGKGDFNSLSFDRLYFLRFSEFRPIFRFSVAFSCILCQISALPLLIFRYIFSPNFTEQNSVFWTIFFNFSQKRCLVFFQFSTSFDFNGVF